ncbi:MAG TPA: secondary thiamine-phosphate synthase enzyme YjbQ [Candidatus Wallbacteria bacterium]|nr:secondary thiamine-phosphate synthase enzyme YjbQ [Candidatus Wallbacteria bacterium]
MKIHTEKFTIKTQNPLEGHNITEKVVEILKNSDISDGICHIFLLHTTAGLYINDDEENLKEDFEIILQKLFPYHSSYVHNMIDNNAEAHLKSIIIGNSVAVPVTNFCIDLKKNQAVFMAEFDGPKERNVIVKIIGI